MDKVEILKNKLEEIDNLNWEIGSFECAEKSFYTLDLSCEKRIKKMLRFMDETQLESIEIFVKKYFDSNKANKIIEIKELVDKLPNIRSDENEI